MKQNASELEERIKPQGRGRMRTRMDNLMFWVNAVNIGIEEIFDHRTFGTEAGAKVSKSFISRYSTVIKS